ncbi:thiol-disulfide oxidoreductase ResA, partial [Virgibacillus sp. M23]|nr:thiol-disulfide oxidoreductase ResA [Virgibacillus sp. M23]
MKKKRRLFIRTGILLVLICALGYTIYNAVFADKESISEGSDAPNFVLEDTNGKRIE